VHLLRQRFGVPTKLGNLISLNLHQMRDDDEASEHAREPGDPTHRVGAELDTG
jgi:hypothetical protein